MTRELTDADKVIDGIFEQVKELPLIQFDLEGTFSKETVCIASNLNIIYYDTALHSL